MLACGPLGEEQRGLLLSVGT
uniref:Uncharacterized protein n=1 Tax=Anguilla anguilla TaxID=7936 RepID=A0A0E9S540_ANGAN